MNFQMYRREDLQFLKRQELIKLCKEHNIKCAGKNSELIEKLLTSLKAEEIIATETKVAKVNDISQIQEQPEEIEEQMVVAKEMFELKENIPTENKAPLQKPVGKIFKKSKLELEKEEARLKLERRLKYNAQASLGKPLPYKPYSGPLNKTEK